MGASSSCCLGIAKAEESPCTENDGVEELNPRSPAETTDTSGRSEYYSERCEAMKRSRGQFSDGVELEIEFSKPHWSEVSRAEVTPQSVEEEELNRENKAVLEQLVVEYPQLFQPDLDRAYVLGRMIAKGGQAEIYEVVDKPDFLMKVFERGTSLRDLRQSWPLPVLKEEVRQCIWVAGMLEDGRFAFVMWRFWGDLRKLIDQAMQEKNVDGIQGPPFPYKMQQEGNAIEWNLHPIDFIWEIARNMSNLHLKGVTHRDLKASNILLFYNFRDIDMYLTTISDFECSIGVLGTKYWRAPEILLALRERETISNELWKKADVYSFGMICFEIVTGKIPFDGEFKNTKVGHQLVIEGKRPQLPSDLDGALKDLITKCWSQDPSLRPTFSELEDMAKIISAMQCEFRLFGIGDELPPQYRLATIEEVDEYTSALSKAMPNWEIANLANGSVDGMKHGFNTRLEKRGDVGYKLARRHN